MNPLYSIVNISYTSTISEKIMKNKEIKITFQLDFKSNMHQISGELAEIQITIPLVRAGLRSWISNKVLCKGHINPEVLGLLTTYNTKIIQKPTIPVSKR